MVFQVGLVFPASVVGPVLVATRGGQASKVYQDLVGGLASAAIPDGAVLVGIQDGPVLAGTPGGVVLADIPAGRVLAGTVDGQGRKVCLDFPVGLANKVYRALVAGPVKTVPPDSVDGRA